MITILFPTPVNNDSLQIGDLAYYLSTNPVGGFNTSTSVPVLIGDVTAITNDSIDVDETVTGNIPPVGAFIMFAKDSSINISGLVGYYAEVKINNNSHKKAEMYCIASGITLSSK